MPRKRNAEALIGMIETPIDSRFLKKCRTEFNKNDKNVIIRNAIAQGGIEDVATDLEEASKIDYLFMNSLKKEHVKATSQGHSGRCWMFAGLNMFRHFMIELFKMKNFEFSESYLYFWDKIERVNKFWDDIMSTLDIEIKIDGDNLKPKEKLLDDILKKPMREGGYWTTFATLASKYGMVPKSVMPETINTVFCDEMNNHLREILRGHAYYFRTHHTKMTPEEIQAYREKVIQQCYDAIVKFMGIRPPERFDWSYRSADEQEGEEITKCQINITPQYFSKIINMAFGKLDNFVIIGNYPCVSYNKLYKCEHSELISGAKPQTYLNLPIRELQKYAFRSINNKVPVYFASDVQKNNHREKFVLNPKILNYDMVLGDIPKMNKSEALKYQQGRPTHAMTFTGADVRPNEDLPFKWQVENSWGYIDDETPGLDGFFVMTDQWFVDHVYEVVIHWGLITPEHQKMFDQTSITIPYGDRRFLSAPLL